MPRGESTLSSPVNPEENPTFEVGCLQLEEVLQLVPLGDFPHKAFVFKNKQTREKKEKKPCSHHLCTLNSKMYIMLHCCDIEGTFNHM